MSNSKEFSTENNTLVLLDQSAGQKQVAILDAFESFYKKRVIIAGEINERQKKLSHDVIWEKATKYNRKNLFLRFASWWLFTIQAYFIIRRKYKKAHLFIITNPPTSTFIPLITRNIFDILVFDLYPDALVEYNYMSDKSIFYKAWFRLNKRIYVRARKIFTLSHGMAERLIQYTDKDKIRIIDLWTDNAYLKPIPKKDNPFVLEHNLLNKCTVMYSGNMGLTHPVEVILDLAQAFRKEDNIHFLLIGGGHKFKMLSQRIGELKLTNVTILPWQPSENLPFSMNSADIGVVTLDDQASKLSVPSKIFDLFSIGVPVLAVGSKDSEMSNILKKYEAGKCFKKEDTDEMVKFIQTLKEDKNLYNQLSQNSLKASLNHTPSNAKAFVN